jgi:uncharacterized protein
MAPRTTQPVKSATLDSNIYVSAFEFGGICARLIGMARVGIFRLDVSETIVDETVGVLRDKFGWDGHSMQDVRQKILKIANCVVPKATLAVVNLDPDDNRILECALEAHSDFLVTHDKDLLRLRTFQSIRIETAVAFVNQGLRD